MLLHCVEDGAAVKGSGRAFELGRFRSPQRNVPTKWLLKPMCLLDYASLIKRQTNGPLEKPPAGWEMRIPRLEGIDQVDLPEHVRHRPCKAPMSPVIPSFLNYRPEYSWKRPFRHESCWRLGVHLVLAPAGSEFGNNSQGEETFSSFLEDDEPRGYK